MEKKSLAEKMRSMAEDTTQRELRLKEKKIKKKQIEEFKKVKKLIKKAAKEKEYEITIRKNSEFPFLCKELLDKGCFVMKEIERHDCTYMTIKW